jgi:hypothetical protein
MIRTAPRRVMLIGVAFLIVGIAAASVAESGQPVSWSFSDDPVESVPQGWEVLSGRWEIQAESGGAHRVLTQVGPPLSDATLAAILAPTLRACDVRIGVRFRSAGMGARETMGLLLRWQGPGTTLAVRVDGSPGWIWVDRVQDGRRSVRAGYVVPPIRTGEWNSLRVVAVKGWLMLFFNDKFLGGVRDDDPAPGRVGLLAGPDGGVSLDDVVIEASPDAPASE